MRSPARVVAHLFVALLPAVAAAQVPDLLDVSIQYTPGAELADPRPTRAQVTSYETAINVPLPLGAKTFLVPGATYHVDSVSYTDPAPELDELNAFHSLELSVLLIQLLPRDWALSLRLAPGLAGDFQGFDTGLLRWSSVALATHTFSPRLVLGGGGLTTFSFGSFLVLPAVYVDWRPWPAFQIEAFVPAFVHARVHLGDRVELGVRAEIAGNAYALRDERVTQGWPCRGDAGDDPMTPPDERIAAPAQCPDHVAWSMATVGAVATVRVIGSVWLSMFAGSSFYRRFEIENDDGVTVEGGAQDLPNTFFVRAGLTWRIPTGS